MSWSWWDWVTDKLAEEREARHWAREDYCYKTCDQHSLENPCPYCDVEEESWDYEQCFEDQWW